MKCKKPGTDQELTLQVFVNGLPCPEFDLPGTTPPDANTLQCFIPVSNGDQITIKGNFIGTCVHGAIDLLLDGTFACDKRMEGHKDGSPRYWKRVVQFEKAFDNPIPSGWRSIYDPPTIVEGDIHAQPITYAGKLGSPDGTELGLGTLAVVFSVNQMSKDSYKHNYPTKVIGAYKTNDPDSMATGGIAPTHELGLKLMDETVSTNRQSRHKRHFTETRFGHKPWAKFIFCYRSRMAIEAAGCVPRPDEYVDLETVTDGSFVAAEPEVRKTKAKVSTAGAIGNGEGDEIAVEKRASTSLFVSPSPGYEETALKNTNALEGTGGSDAGGENQFVSMENDRTKPAVRVKTEPAEKPKTPAQPSPKRPFPNDSVSRESTPSKRARISELQARKAAVLATNQEKLQRKLAEEKKLEDDRKKRAEEEDELLRQIAEAEREGMELDEATEEIVKLREMENAED